MVHQHLVVQHKILEHYLDGTEDPVRVAQSELAQKFPEICKEIQDVSDAVNSNISLGNQSVSIQVFNDSRNCVNRDLINT